MYMYIYIYFYICIHIHIYPYFVFRRYASSSSNAHLINLTSLSELWSCSRLLGNILYRVNMDVG